jgi:DNA polymerase-3 subunit beta
VKFEASRDVLQEGLQTISGAVANKSTLPILMNILLEAEGDTLTMTATDLEISVQSHVEATIEEEGSCTIPAKKLQRLIKELPSPDTQLFLKTQDERAEIQVEETNSEFQLPILPPDDFPSLPEVEDGFEVSLDSDTLDHLLEHTHFAAATDTSRSYLCGVYFDLKADELTMVATDAHRLALQRTPLNGFNAGDKSMLVPIKAAQELAKILPENESIDIHSDNNLVEFTMNGTRLISRLVEEDFPDYHQVIPDEFEKRITVDRQRLHDAVKRMSLLADEKTRRLLVTVEPDTLRINAETSDKGGGEETIPIDYDGESQTIAFNGDYLGAVLDHVEDDQIHFDLISENSPGTFRPIDDDHYLYIIMPLRLN